MSVIFFGDDEAFLTSNYAWSRPDIKEAILSSNNVLSDLDDTIAESTAKSFGFDFAKYMLKNPEVEGVAWIGFAIAETVKHKVGMNNDYKNTIWNKLRDEVLTDEHYDLLPLGLRNPLFPGVKDFYEALPVQNRVLVTRNIAGLAESYMDELGFNIGYFKVSDKSAVAKNFRNHVVIGDSIEDACMTEGSNISIQICKTPEHYDSSKFEIGISRNYTPLVDILSFNSV